MTQGFSNADVIQRLLGKIKMDYKHVGRRGQMNLESAFAQAIDPLLLGGNIDAIHLAVSERQFACGVVRRSVCRSPFPASTRGQNSST